jgi:hypothetical protein
VKAITLWQPWATLIAIGAKHFETRSWATPYRGPLAIHAAKRPVERSELLRSMADALVSAGFTGTGQLPLSCVVCVVDLVNCYPTQAVMREEWFEPHKEREMDFGDFTHGRYAWQLENVRFQENLFARGYQGLWDWDAPMGWE